ncbi:MAG TPA: redox-sensing transcriptional repressor Rex [Firmicutes bacterium]|uniref:Redox-sensing transcriptional repressor Rex n=1 Tax=Capillibacterium thermochitinicola TaxID=2699427 RepID=A0A8J6LHY8_9FIRM|nr:redox-sensing transcriptional repressor Rex [Capillibacterium thermochitinicola]MBA2132061.1 redox-sensing transcriptional repressor Rex [Capillibacterium thermochitinicola]HHW11998.1 redox-sensing transcriptional repressor Rex [Bacillota bacterium]
MPEGLVSFPKATIARFPLYLRALTEYSHQNIVLVSSEEMAQKVGVTPSQLRKDLSYFGSLGIRGTGYDVSYLLMKIKEILGMDRKRRLGIIGAGKLGMALAGYSGFQQHGLEVAALFDTDPTKWGPVNAQLEVFPLTELAAQRAKLGLDIAVITVPKAEAQRVAELAVEAGFPALWNFAPVRLEVPPEILVQYEDIVVGVLTLSHHLARKLGS